MPPLTLQDKGLTKGTSCPSHCPISGALEPLPHMLGNALPRPPGPCVPGWRVSPHVSMGRATCCLLCAAALGAAQPCGVSLTTRGIAPASLRYDRHSAWQATPSWTVYRLACQRLLPWLRVTFAMVPDAAWPGSDQWPWNTTPATGPVSRLGRPSASDPRAVGSFLSLSRPTCVQCPGPLGSCSPYVPARFAVLCLRCHGPLGSSSPVCSLGVLCCLCGVLNN